MSRNEELTVDQAPIPAFRFIVSFLGAGAAPNPIDFRFSRVSGLGASVTLDSVEEGGQNLFTHRLPKKVQYNNLVLERGMMISSPLTLEFNAAMSLLKTLTSNVMVFLLDEHGQPISSWLYIKAYPISWTTTDLDANSNSIVMETMELAYERMQAIRL